MNGASEAVRLVGKAAVAESAEFRSSRDWRRLTEAAAVTTALLDAALLQRKHALFTGGFLANNF